MLFDGKVEVVKTVLTIISFYSAQLNTIFKSIKIVYFFIA